VFDLQGVVPSSGLIKVGTFLATITYEEVKPMLDLKLATGKRTIMLVDDDPEIVAVVRTMLEQNGYNVRCAYSGMQLFAALAEQKPDLIILDVMMPNLDGLEVLARLKGVPGTSSIPVILLTALNQYEEIFEGYKTGADHYITKPFTKTQLMTGIHRLLSGDQGHPEESLYRGQSNI
jgi:DNA-binding response OmpR family regulator